MLYFLAAALALAGAFAVALVALGLAAAAFAGFFLGLAVLAGLPAAGFGLEASASAFSLAAAFAAWTLLGLVVAGASVSLMIQVGGEWVLPVWVTTVGSCRLGWLSVR